SQPVSGGVVHRGQEPLPCCPPSTSVRLDYRIRLRKSSVPGQRSGLDGRCRRCCPGVERQAMTTEHREPGWEEREVGVGAWDGQWPEGDQWDQTLLAEGDRRNVADHYRYWTVEAIVADLDTRRHPLHIAIENWQHDFNIGTVVRTANAFNVAGVHIIGRRRWNRRGAMVTDK